MSNQVFFRGLAVVFLSAGLFSCSSNPNKPGREDTQLENAEAVSTDQQLGLNSKGEVVMNRKVRLADQLKDLQKDVYQLEVDIYGEQKLGRRGLYGILRRCLDEGDELKRLPARTILTKPEDDIRGRMVLDENDQLVNVSEEFFLERIQRFEGYRDAYSRQKEDFEEKIRICEHDLKKKRANQ